MTLNEFSFIEFSLVCFRFCKSEVPGCEDSIERWQFFIFYSKTQWIVTLKRLSCKRKKSDLDNTLLIWVQPFLPISWCQLAESIVRLPNGNRWCGSVCSVLVVVHGCTLLWADRHWSFEMTVHSYFPLRHVALDVWCWMTQCWSVWRHFPTNHCKHLKDNVIGATHTLQPTNANIWGLHCFRISGSPSWLCYTAHSLWLCDILYYVITV